MLRLIFFYFILFSVNVVIAQTTRVAILDFDNISGIAKFDGLGKAMSSMLITDIEANVSPKRLQLVERAQIQKILKEQNFQSSDAVDKSTAVRAGKILGVKYLLVGDIYILDDVLVINARLTDTETGDIKFSKKQEGKVSTWLMLKTNIAKELASSISMPFTDPNIPDKEINVATITTFGNALVAKDEGKFEKAEELLNTVAEFSPDFKYLDDLKAELDVLKKQVEKNTASIQILEKSGGRVINANSYDELINNLQNGLTSSKEKTECLLQLFESYPYETEQNMASVMFYPVINSLGYSEESFLNDVMILNDLMSRSSNKRICSIYAVGRLKNLSYFFVNTYYKSTDLPVEKRMLKVNEVTQQLREFIGTLVIDESEKSKLGLLISNMLLTAFVPLEMSIDEEVELITLLSIDSFNEINTEIRYYSSRVFTENNSWVNFVFAEIDNIEDYIDYVEWLVKYSNNLEGFSWPHEFNSVLKNIFKFKLYSNDNFYILDLGDDRTPSDRISKQRILNILFFIDENSTPKLDLKEFEKVYSFTIKESEFYAQFRSSVNKKIKRVEGENIDSRYFSKILLYKHLATDNYEIICLF